MRWNPIFRKEIVTDSRGSRLAVIVFATNLILVAAAMINLFSMISRAMATAEIQYSSILDLYALISSLEFMMLLIIMPALTAPAVSGEREKQTFDLLMTTPLRPRTFIWGKLASSETEMMVLLFSALPVQSLVFIFGGVTGEDLLLLYLTFAVTVTFVGAIGIFCSVIFRRSVAANAAAYLITALLAAGTAALCRYGTTLASGQTGAIRSAGNMIYLLLFNPAVTFDCVINGQAGAGDTVTELTSLFGTVPENFVTVHWIALSLLLQTLVAALLIAAAVRLVVPGRLGNAPERKKRAE